MATFYITGGVQSPAVLDGFIQYDGILVSADLGGSVAINAIVTGGVSPQASIGGTVKSVSTITGGISSTAYLDGLIRDPFFPGVYGGATLGGGISATYRITGGVSSTASVDGAFVNTAFLSGGIQPTASVGGRWVFGISGGVVASVVLSGGMYSRGVLAKTEVGGSFRVTRLESISLDNDYYNSGVRPATPLIVYALNVVAESTVADLGNGQAFLVSNQFDGGPGNALYDAGAEAGYVGYYNRPGTGTTISFRKPEDWETVYSMTDGKLYRFELNRDAGTWGWVKYRSMPQRALDGMQAFNAFDPDRIYDYVATIMGGYLAQLQYDAKVSRTVRDPDLVPRLYVPAALENIGASIDSGISTVNDASTESVQRYFLATTPVLNKWSGHQESAEGRLRALGFSGYVTVRWSKLGWPAIFVEASTLGSEHNIEATASGINVFGFDGGSNTSTAWAVITIPPQRANASEGSWVSLTAYGAPNVVRKFVYYDYLGVTARVQVGGGFRVVSSGVTTPSRDAFESHIKVNNGLTADESLNNLRVAIDATGDFVVQPTTGVPGELTLDTPWCYSDGALLTQPAVYWPTKFVTIHLNLLDGSPYRPTNPDEVTRVRDLIRSSLYEDVLPIHSRIAQWATDADDSPSTIEVTETFTIA